MDRNITQTGFSSPRSAQPFPFTGAVGSSLGEGKPVFLRTMAVPMASDWIKMRTDIYRDPKVCRIADLIVSESDVMRNVTRNVTRNAIVGALVTVWGVARQRGKVVGVDLVIANANEKVVDDIADLPGLGSSMLKSGWLAVDGNDLVFPRFFEDYNSPTSENKNAERQRRYREKCNVTRNVTRNVVSNVTVTGNREEKSREDKDIGVGKPTEPEKPKRKPKPVFIVPTTEEVAAYCRERGNSIDPQRFVDHYTSNGWVVGKAKMKDWRAAVRTWEKNEIQRNGKPPPKSDAQIDAEAAERKAKLAKLMENNE